MAVDAKIIEKIQKLMALGMSPNENEAKSALRKAAELMEMHNLAASDMTVNKDGSVSMDIGEGSVGRVPLKMRVWAEPLAVVLDKCFGTKSILSRDMLITIGGKEDIKMHTEMYKRLRLIMARMASAKYSLVQEQKMYCIGLLRTITERLYSAFIAVQEEVRSANTTALVIVKDKEVAAAVAERFPQCRVAKQARVNWSHREAYDNGREDGKNVRLGIKEMN